MSKASDYAARCAAANARPKSFELDGGSAHVTKEGHIFINGGANGDAAKALALADWIKETFGE